MSDVDNLLYRDVKPGTKYMDLIPDSACESSYLGEGDTKFSVTSMAGWVKQYAWQMQDVAPLLQGSTLDETCRNIHIFCYDHIQYHADADDQYLRSPSCAKKQRYEGIDCKSYSILASCILVNLGISHYIRRVKQPMFHPELWTHVYVIVPDNQKTGSLDNGYYVIDGTVNEDEEGLITQKSDTYMDAGLKHYGLNGVQGLNGATLDQMKSYIFSGGKISLKNLSCIGGTLDASDVNFAIPAIITYWDAAISQLNDAIQNNSGTVLAQVNGILSTAYQMRDHSDSYVKNKNWDSTCSTNAAKCYQATGAYYYNVVTMALMPWLAQYFNSASKTITAMNNTFPVLKGGSYPLLETSYKKGSENKGFYKGSFNHNCSILQLTSLVLKQGPLEVKRFELTPYIATAGSTGTFDVAQTLGSLKNVLAQFGVQTGSTGAPATTTGSTIPVTSTGGIVANTGDDDDIDTVVPVTPTTPKSAGFGTVAAIAIGGIAITMIISSMMGKPAIKGITT